MRAERTFSDGFNQFFEKLAEDFANPWFPDLLEPHFLGWASAFMLLFIAHLAVIFAVGGIVILIRRAFR